jgi:hypothetical protein
MADELNIAISDVAVSKVSIKTTIRGRDAQVIYVGQTQQCDAVSVVWPDKRIDNFRVCANEVIPRYNLSPAWDSEDGRPTFVSVVNNAILRGRAQQMDRNGYLVSAQAFNALKNDCKIVEVIVSYDFDLVDWDLHEMCDKQHN